MIKNDENKRKTKNKIFMISEVLFVCISVNFSYHDTIDKK
jgi:hypothetical protein